MEELIRHSFRKGVEAATTAILNNINEQMTYEEIVAIIETANKASQNA